MSDFPAAHSMDTTWFAIDADGYVGIFDSSEGGAVPDDLTKVEDRIDSRWELVELLCQNKYEKIQNTDSVDPEDIIKDASQFFLKCEILKHEELSKLYPAVFYPFIIKHRILELSNELVIEELKEIANIIIKFAGERIIVYVDRCDREWLKQAIESKKILAGKEAMLEFNLSWLGWYEYDNDCSTPIPYNRKYRLKQPLHFDDLLPEIRDRLSMTELPNIRFAETESIQPIEHMPCRTWGGSEYWIDIKGVEHDRFPDY